MSLLALVFLLAAFILFLLAAVGVQSRLNLIALGLACWTFSLILGAWR